MVQGPGAELKVLEAPRQTIAVCQGDETFKPDPRHSEWRFRTVGQPHPAARPGCAGKVDAMK